MQVLLLEQIRLCRRWIGESKPLIQSVMKKPTTRKTAAKKRAATSRKPVSNPAPGKIRPVITYPFRDRDGFTDLEQLYGLVERLDADRETYARPITVIDRKTSIDHEGDKEFRDFRRDVVEKHSDVMDAWCVDTCQMWYTGLGKAFDQGGEDDVYWLIPGAFNYGSRAGQAVLGHLHDLPEICMELRQDLCIGEIATDHNDSTQLIDTYGTFVLLYHWFPKEGQEIRQFTERPRSKFFAVRHDFLRAILRHRWYAYEQTVVMLLRCMFAKRKISRYYVGAITDLHVTGESYNAAVQEVERTERVLKTLWRERNQDTPDWIDRYHKLEAESEQIVQTAFNVLRNVIA